MTDAGVGRTSRVANDRPPSRRLWGSHRAAITFGIICVLYLPVLLTQFGVLDDYFHLARISRGDPGSFAAFAIGGRPLQGMLTIPGFAAAGSIDGLRWLRLVAVLGTAGVGGYFTFLLSRWNWGRAESVAAGVVVAALPPFQVYASWAIMFSVPVAALIAMLAARVALAAHEGPGRMEGIARGAMAVGLLTTSMLIYQPAAMMFLVVGVAAVVAAAGRSVGRPVAVMIGVFVGGMVASLALFRLTAAVYGQHPTRTELVSDVIGKVEWFIREPLTRSLNVTQLTRSYTMALFVGLLIVAGLWVGFRGRPRDRALLTLAVLAVVPLSYFPSLLVAENWASYRSQIALASMVAVLLMFSVRNATVWMRHRLSKVPVLLGPIVLVALAVLAGVSATRNVTGAFVVPQNTELKLVWAQVQEAGDAERVLFVLPEAYPKLGHVAVFDEFGFASTAAVFVAEPIVYLLRQQTQWKGTPVTVTIVGRDEIADHPDVPVIDMTGLGDHRLPGAP